VTEAGTGRPLANVQVSLRGGQRGTLTGASGQYAITEVSPGEAVVTVESIGYRSGEQTVTVQAGQTVTADFELSQAAIDLDEIVVTGTAGRTTRRALGNSVSTVNAEAITESAPISNVQDLLHGRTPGVQLLSSTGVVGGSSRIRVRGSSSLSAGNEPVVFIDGVRVQGGTEMTQGNTAQGVSMLESINPHDIESMEVIKGPAAATLYGAEAAAGVIQIITKKGRAAEGLQWTANFEYGRTDWAVDRITNYWLCTSEADNHPLDAISPDGRFNDSNPGCMALDASQPLSERLLVDDPFDMTNRSQGVYRQLEDMGLPTDRFSCQFPEQVPCEPRPIREGNAWNTNLSVRGGGENYNFYISGERNEEEGTFFNNINNRTSARANFGFVPSEQLNFSVNVGYATTEQRLPLSDNSSNGVLRNAYRGQAGGPRGTYLPGYRGFMPEFSNQYDRQVSAERLTMGLTTNYTPFSWLQNRLTLGLDRNDRENRFFQQIDQTGEFPDDLGFVNIAYPLNHIWTVDYAGTATTDLATEWSSAFSVGMQLTKRREEESEVEGEGLVTNSLNLVGAAAQRTADQDFSEQTSLGFFVQEQVGWRDRLFATAAVRVDDNSAFGRDFSLVVYPKASLSWVISEEDFFNVGFVDQLKLRAAWGQAGNAPEPFSADRTYESGRTVIGDAPVNRLITDSYGNPDLKAETGSEIELGFDASFLEGRLGADFTFYNKSTQDALLEVAVPPSSGWTGDYLRNVGEIKNWGVELGLNGSLIRRRSVQWDVLASIASNRNELISFGLDGQGNPILNEIRFGPFIDAQRHREGFPLGGFWATDVVRDANGVPVLDEDGNATLESCTSWPDDCNEEYIGPMLPTLQLGLTNTLTLFDNLRLYVFADYQGGNYQWCAICSIRTRIDRNTAEINDPDLTPEQFAYLNTLQTAEYIYPADFLKLREASVTYTLPSGLVDRIGFRRASLTVSGRNLWMWTKYDGPSDPEVTFTSTDDFQMADYGSIPMQRRFVLSMNFNF
jgi:TonB-linked SusC/RagA family outer membrane protein